MTGHSRQEIAHQAGVPAPYVDRLADGGMLAPVAGDRFSSGDVRRARWIHNFEQAGVPLEDMAAAVGDGTLSFSFLDESAFDRFTGLSNNTFEELSNRTGIPLELLAVVREALAIRSRGQMTSSVRKNWQSYPLSSFSSPVASVPWTLTGTMPDGRRLEVNGCDFLTVRDGKILIKNAFRKQRPPFDSRQ